jgi:hypothetical protein
MIYVGSIAVTWNNIHNELCKIFVLTSGMKPKVATAAWNSLQSDRHQRTLLQATIGAALIAPDLLRAKRKINDLLNQINELSSKRDSSVHSPFTMTLEGGKLRAVPDSDFGNKHAQSLKPEAVRTQLFERSVQLGDLEDYARNLALRLQDPGRDVPWPKKRDMLRMLQSPSPGAPSREKVVQLHAPRKPSSDR